MPYCPQDQAVEDTNTWTSRVKLTPPRNQAGGLRRLSPFGLSVSTNEVFLTSKLTGGGGVRGGGGWVTEMSNRHKLQQLLASGLDFSEVSKKFLGTLKLLLFNETSFKE